MEFEKMTAKMWEIPWSPPNIPDPMSVSFRELEERIKPVVNELWKCKEELEDQVSELHPIWAVSLRMTVMYLNMSDAFYECGIEFMQAASDESSFIEKYDSSKGKNKRDRASRLLARTVKLLRVLSFQSSLISIGSDSHYSGASCEETNQLLNKLRATEKNKDIADNKDVDDQTITMFIKFLLHIGKGEGFISPEGEPHSKAREIGEMLNEMGGLILMQSVARQVATLLQEIEGRVVGRELEYCWDRIGDWRA